MQIALFRNKYEKHVFLMREKILWQVMQTLGLFIVLCYVRELEAIDHPLKMQCLSLLHLHYMDMKFQQRLPSSSKEVNSPP